MERGEKNGVYLAMSILENATTLGERRWPHAVP